MSVIFNLKYNLYNFSRKPYALKSAGTVWKQKTTFYNFQIIECSFLVLSKRLVVRVHYYS